MLYRLGLVISTNWHGLRGEILGQPSHGLCYPRFTGVPGLVPLFGKRFAERGTHGGFRVRQPFGLNPVLHRFRAAPLRVRFQSRHFPRLSSAPNRLVGGFNFREFPVRQLGFPQTLDRPIPQGIAPYADSAGVVGAIERARRIIERHRNPFAPWARKNRQARLGPRLAGAFVRFGLNRFYRPDIFRPRLPAAAKSASSCGVEPCASRSFKWRAASTLASLAFNTENIFATGAVPVSIFGVKDFSVRSSTAPALCSLSCFAVSTDAAFSARSIAFLIVPRVVGSSARIASIAPSGEFLKALAIAFAAFCASVSTCFSFTGTVTTVSFFHSTNRPYLLRSRFSIAIIASRAFFPLLPFSAKHHVLPASLSAFFCAFLIPAETTPHNDRKSVNASTTKTASFAARLASAQASTSDCEPPSDNALSSASNSRYSSFALSVSCTIRCAVIGAFIATATAATEAVLSATTCQIFCPTSFSAIAPSISPAASTFFQ